MKSWESLKIGRPMNIDKVIRNYEDMHPDSKGRIVTSCLMTISNGEVEKGDNLPLLPSVEGYDFASQYHYDFNKYKSIITDAFRVNEAEFRFYLNEWLKKSPYQWHKEYHSFLAKYGNKDIPTSTPAEKNTSPENATHEVMTTFLYYLIQSGVEHYEQGKSYISKLCKKYKYPKSAIPVYRDYPKGNNHSVISNKNIKNTLPLLKDYPAAYTKAVKDLEEEI